MGGDFDKLRYYLPTTVVKSIEDRLQDEKKSMEAPMVESLTAVTMFVDVAGFTKLTKKLSGVTYGQELLTDALNKYLSFLVKTISGAGKIVLCLV